MKKIEINGALEISSNADVPAGTGLGSSSAFTVGLLHNLYARNGKFVRKEKLASEACDIEINRLKDPIGKQDQYAAAFGGLNIIRFNADESVSVEPLHLKEETLSKLQNNLILFYLGGDRSAAKILTEQNKNSESATSRETLKEMTALVDEARIALCRDDLYSFGKILDYNWNLKKRLASKITNSKIDAIYTVALKNGAIGGKLLGAGGSGFMFFYVEEKNHSKLKQSLSTLQELKFKFENQGTSLLYAGDEYG